MYTSSSCFRLLLARRGQEPWKPLSIVAKKLIETTEIIRIKRNGCLIYVTPGEVREDDVAQNQLSKESKPYNNIAVNSSDELSHDNNTNNQPINPGVDVPLIKQANKM